VASRWRTARTGQGQQRADGAQQGQDKEGSGLNGAQQVRQDGRVVEKKVWFFIQENKETSCCVRKEKERKEVGDGSF